MSFTGFPSGQTLLTVAIAFAALLVGLMLLRLVLRLTARFLALGCFLLLILGAALFFFSRLR
ncbi:MAG: hypothetical protein HY784_02530 [Chloroflexi bacterium]|nr:hypothetical protein [Chloroflexota bacterium]